MAAGGKVLNKHKIKCSHILFLEVIFGNGEQLVVLVQFYWTTSQSTIGACAVGRSIRDTKLVIWSASQLGLGLALV